MPTRKLLALPVASKKLRKHVTTRNKINSRLQFIGHVLSSAEPLKM